MLHNLLQDIRFGIRALFKSKLFAIAAIVTLALGIGANTAVFSAVNAVLLAPLPFQNAEELVVIWRTALNTKTDQFPESIPNFEDLKAQNQSFEKLAAIRGQQVILTDGDQPERTGGARASANFFSTLQVKPILGRDFLAGEDQQGASPVVIISHRLWQDRYGAETSVIGRTITIDRKSYTIVGVLPQGVYYPNPETSLYVPFIYQPAEINRGQAFFRVIGRLKPGVSLAQARAELDTIAARLTQQYPDVNTNVGYNPVLIRDQIVGPIRMPLIVLLAAAASVLLIACANIANLLLARASARRGEFAIRAALGATRMQVVRQMIIESVLLSAIGGTLGLLLALGGVPLLISISADNIPRAAEIGINLRVLGFTAIISLFTATVAGLAPALRFSSNETIGALREGRRGATGGVAHQRLLRAFVISQLAIALVLLVVAGLMIRSFRALNNVAPGFNPKGVLTLGVGIPAASYPDIPAQARFYDRLVTEIRTLTGVKSAASVIRLPVVGANASTTFTIYGQGTAAKDAASVDFRPATQDYFKTMEIPILKGRDFTDREIKGGPDVVIINKTMETRFFPNGEALGQRIQILPEPDRWREIIGVSGDVKLQGLDADVNPAMYVPMVQNIYPNALRNVFLVVRTDLDPKSLVPGIRARLRTLDKEIPISQVQTMEDAVSGSLAQRRLSMSLLVVFAVLAALLAAVGIYGVMAYTVTQRTQEIGIRLAMGARSVDVLKMVLGDGTRLALIGVFIGLLVAFALTRIIAGLLYGVSAVDPITFVCIPVLLAIVTLLASYLPARRASKVDPIIALRNN